jgi:hypothetical protein
MLSQSEHGHMAQFLSLKHNGGFLKAAVPIRAWFSVLVLRTCRQGSVSFRSMHVYKEHGRVKHMTIRCYFICCLPPMV